MTRCPWLPDLVLLSDHRGSWANYVDALYRHFTHDFVLSKPVFRGERLALKRHPMEQGKEATFWHLTSTGRDEASRLPDLRRCERIRWPRPVIDNSTDHPVSVWANKRGGEERICLWIRADNYLVVLARRKGYLLPWTAYCVEQEHTRRKLEREFEAAKKAGAAL